MQRGEARGRSPGLWALVVALSCIGLLSLAAFSPRARATRPHALRALTSSCSSGGESSVFLFGGGGRLVAQTDMSVCATGRLTVTFTGDPGTGCAAHGLCGYAGTETWQPQNDGDLALATFEQHGRRFTTATMTLGAPGNPVRSAVQHSQATGTTTSCSDQSQGGLGFFALPVAGARVRIGLRGAEEPLLGTRCAGPLDADVAAALTSRTLGLNRLLRGDVTIALTASGRFAAHGLAGTVRSTIVLVVGRPHRSSGTAGSSLPPGITRTRLTQVTYRVTRLEGSAVAAVRSSAITAACGPFDACGLAGEIDVAPGALSGGSVSLSATAALHRPKRDLLAALGVAKGGNPAGISVQGGGAAPLHHGEVIANLPQGAGTCHDQTRLRQAGIELRQRADRLQISVSPTASQAADPLRTRCPGPQLGSHQLTSASLPLSALRHPTLTVALHGDSFTDGPYSVTTHTTLTLTLRRTVSKTQIVP
ncbi:MAG: hypothetical protein WAU75_14940 [Solirubrobacteraceae bacterium]